ncbi:hypothetical protein BDV98DRAFT_576220 [Pterulicium gracile]|uniref:Uncharacterized protein n=1 Tax=Pterulicium gracile TaxID=1884261 RepID=A0A5C3Q5V9_9AGAR|nr:hypothetical protein BDV98DRAFT_576220 [Pterula gracilis]
MPPANPSSSGPISGTFIDDSDFIVKHPEDYRRSITLMTEVFELLTISHRDYLSSAPKLGESSTSPLCVISLS